MQKAQALTRESIAQAVREALKDCEITKVIGTKDGDMPLAIESFDWYNLWEHLEHKIGVTMNFDPRDGLTNIPNCTPNIIIDFLYDKLQAQETTQQVLKQKRTFGRLFEKRR